MKFDKQYYKNITENKSMEFVARITSMSHQLFDFNVGLSLRGRDHAGFYFYLVILKFNLEFNIYDRRHWNDEKGRWSKNNED